MFKKSDLPPLAVNSRKYPAFPRLKGRSVMDDRGAVLFCRWCGFGDKRAGGLGEYCPDLNFLSYDCWKVLACMGADLGK